MHGPDIGPASAESRSLRCVMAILALLCPSPRNPFTKYNTHPGSLDLMIFESSLSLRRPSSPSRPRSNPGLLFSPVMATSISSKRPVVLSLGELQRYPTIRSRYEITVPFNVRDYTFQNPLRCNCPAQRPDGMYNFACQGCDVSFSFAKLKAKAVEQTEKRWVVSSLLLSILEHLLA